MHITGIFVYESADHPFRSFNLKLQPLDEDSSPFHYDHYVDVDGDYADIKPHHFLYEGHVNSMFYLCIRENWAFFQMILIHGYMGLLLTEFSMAIFTPQMDTHILWIE